MNISERSTTCEGHVADRNACNSMRLMEGVSARISATAGATHLAMQDHRAFAGVEAGKAEARAGAAAKEGAMVKRQITYVGDRHMPRFV